MLWAISEPTAKGGRRGTLSRDGNVPASVRAVRAAGEDSEGAGNVKSFRGKEKTYSRIATWKLTLRAVFK